MHHHGVADLEDQQIAVARLSAVDADIIQRQASFDAIQAASLARLAASSYIPALR